MTPPAPAAREESDEMSSPKPLPAAASRALPATSPPPTAIAETPLYLAGYRAAREAAAGLAEAHHADVLRLRHAALRLAGNAPGTPVPEWVDAAVNDPAVMASGDAAELVGENPEVIS